MRECSKEEKTPAHKDYVPPKIVTDYLVLNDVRPLKKVNHPIDPSSKVKLFRVALSEPPNKGCDLISLIFLKNVSL